MNKIEFISISLLYGLKVLRGDNITILRVSGIDVDCKSLLFTESNTTTYGSISHSKPILRPLSEVTKEIEHKGETFIPGYKLAEMGWSVPAILFYPNSVIDQNTLPVFVFKKLVEWHFDIIGLIDKNEAIDYHTLEGFVF